MVVYTTLKQLKKLNGKGKVWERVSITSPPGPHHNPEQGGEEELNLVRTLVFRNEVNSS
jgi:hypothetical protein